LISHLRWIAPSGRGRVARSTDFVLNQLQPQKELFFIYFFKKKSIVCSPESAAAKNSLKEKNSAGRKVDRLDLLRAKK
jgi:hypothetical protein